MTRSAIRFALSALAAFAMGAAALPARSQQPVPPREFHFALLGGLTAGGDTLAEIRYSDGTSDRVKAGELVHFGAGFVWHPPQSPVSLQATFGWHASSAYVDAWSGSGDIRFSRLPIELLGYLHPAPYVRFGGGVRWVTSPELRIDVAGAGQTIRFRDTTGLVLEGGYRFGARTWLNLRYTNEDYEAESVNGFAVVPTGRSSGRSVGINVVFML